MRTLDQILQLKGHDVLTASPDVTVYESLTLLAEYEVGALVVLDEGRPVGLLSERDYARKVIIKGLSSRDTLVRDIMACPVLCVDTTLTVDKALGIMTERRIRHLPVLDNAGQLTGIVSIGDLVKDIIAEQQYTIDQLQHYIHS
ncbi:MAG: histidine kinase [Acidiferrobacteraceae bacterium]|jgi:CBS domain-containing protein|nr:histidine kinase [Acidiferrobacteraceae bacterium]MCP4828403.1 CBS domain-containing protein [Pseudomonadota bacterium]MDP6950501.1 CBS domain-containing protein [Arenicellales bacterium]HJP07823.1 CBS domain-containing protein [Arenicellales bacterium]|tara:strand:+ start:2229 stop:2660 length:432 start_codon:yes stop_codon:yes gene_type:complete